MVLMVKNIRVRLHLAMIEEKLCQTVTQFYFKLTENKTTLVAQQ